jgi:hypothetical protein
MFVPDLYVNVNADHGGIPGPFGPIPATGRRTSGLAVRGVGPVAWVTERTATEGANAEMAEVVKVFRA